MCDKSESLSIPPTGGYLTSTVVHSSIGNVGEGGGLTCGTTACPWRLTAEPGQQINLTVWDYSSTPDAPTQTIVGGGRTRETAAAGGGPGGVPHVSSASICYRYASIWDGPASSVKDLTFCDPGEVTSSAAAGSARRHSHMSSSHVIQLSVYAALSPSVHFIIKYEGTSFIQSSFARWRVYIYDVYQRLLLRTTLDNVRHCSVSVLIITYIL